MTQSVFDDQPPLIDLESFPCQGLRWLAGYWDIFESSRKLSTLHLPRAGLGYVRIVGLILASLSLRLLWSQVDLRTLPGLKALTVSHSARGALHFPKLKLPVGLV
jgi:hypothetical protein